MLVHEGFSSFSRVSLVVQLVGFVVLRVHEMPPLSNVNVL